ncbi:MAG TPA: hypothetical protein EYQ00_07560 [Dehalococcoidia bacterium]|nr:hypothetical protein [Dehalococcoidia bacterium]
MSKITPANIMDIFSPNRPAIIPAGISNILFPSPLNAAIKPARAKDASRSLATSGIIGKIAPCPAEIRNVGPYTGQNSNLHNSKKVFF